MKKLLIRVCIGMHMVAAFCASGKDADGVRHKLFQKGDLITHCEYMESPIQWRYCVTTTEGSRNRTILYFLHGRGHNERNWAESKDYKANIRAEWKERGIEPPVVVTISFGGFWLLVDQNSSKRSGLLDFFAEKAVPFIERDLPPGPHPKRWLMGESMGGFNAAQVVMKHPELFDRAVLACPAIAGISPRAGFGTVVGYIRKEHADPFRAWMMMALARQVFRNDADWAKSDPFTIGKTSLSPKAPPLMISCGDRDQYGFYRGVKSFVDLAQTKGVQVTWTPIEGGGHCSADPRAIAEFLSYQSNGESKGMLQ